MRPHLRWALSLEEASDGKSNTETEHVFYARLKNLDQLKQADAVEGQEQWEIRLPKTEQNAAEGVIRIRRTNADIHAGDDQGEFVLTTKTKLSNSSASRMEVPIPTTIDHFEQFKQLAPFGLIKHRYTFKVPNSNLKWEVDMFLNPNQPTQYQPWCKIDLEVQDIADTIPQFPLEVEEMIGPNHQFTAEQHRFVRGLYDQYFLTPNQRLEK